MVESTSAATPERRSQLLVAVTLGAMSTAIAGVLAVIDPALFRRFIGGTHPLVVFALAGLVAGYCRRTLLARGWFAIDINVPLPQSLLFYPAIGYLVEIVFHVLPLTITLGALSALLPGALRRFLVWSAIMNVALLEPVYQCLDMRLPLLFGSA